MHIFGTDIDLNRNQAKNFRWENGIALPSVAASDSGLTFYHSGLSKFYGWTGATWIDLGASGGGSYTLPTATDIILGGVKIDGTTINIDGSGVISAAPAIIASGLEEVTEGLNTGWRFIGESVGDGINRYPIGNKAIDGMQFRGTSIGLPDVPGLPYGTKSVDGIHFGVDNKDNATYNSTILGTVNRTNAYAFATMIGGYNNIGYGYGDTCIGSYNTTSPSNVNSFLTAIGHNVTMNAAFGGVGLGLAVTNSANGSVVVGTSNTIWAGGASAADRPMFQVGIGTTFTPAARWTSNVRQDGFTVKKNGLVIGDSLTTALITGEATGRVLVTKEWITTQGFSATAPTGLESITEGANTGWRLIGKDPTKYADIGNLAVDFSIQLGLAGAVYGASGYGSLAAGNSIIASNSYSVGFGHVATSSGYASLASGHFLSALSYAETAVGHFNTIYVPASTTAWNTADRSFGVGIGANGGARADGLLVLKSGEVTAPSLTTAIIDADTTGRVLMTKEGIKPKYTVASVITAANIDWNFDTHRITMTGATTFTDTNLPTSGTNTKVITIYMDGNFVPTWPAGWTTYVTGTYDGTVLNQIVVEFISTGLYWVDINRAD
tara:strand:+ start:24431 stop:26254 length:1824 start_codon:yes stop_codon:yes gene_type:complete